MDERTTEVSDVRDKETAFEENLATREGTGDEMENKERHPSENFRDKASATLLELPVTANISLTYAEEACILRPIFLLKKAKGCPDWDRTAPMAMVEASVSTTKVLIVCFLACTLVYGAVAVLGYLMFGEDVKSQVTFNLPSDKFSSQVAIYTTLVNPITKYALNLTPAMIAIKNKVSFDYNKKFTHMIVGTFYSTVIVAVTIPLFGSVMSIAGALLCMSASILVPCVCYMKISGAYKR